MSVERDIPDGLVPHEEEVSNFDHVIPDGLESDLRTGKFFTCHPAWEHHGIIWYEDGLFHEQVSRYRAVVDVISAPTLKEVFEAVNEKWGNK